MFSMVQKFEFENDSLEDFERMLEVIVHTEFRHQNSEYTKLHIKKKSPSSWDDGSEYKWTNDGIIEIGGKHYGISPCATYHGATRYKTLSEYKTLDEAAEKTKRCDKLPATRLWVATLGESASNYKKGEDHYCQSRSQMINHAIIVMRNAADKKEEFEKLREPDWMRSGDGSVNMGFRISSEWEYGARVLTLSLCHIYYGK